MSDEDGITEAIGALRRHFEETDRRLASGTEVHELLKLTGRLQTERQDCIERVSNALLQGRREVCSQTSTGV